MAKFSKILEISRALLNDQSDAVYHDSVLLPYLNLSLQELQEIFELNSIPVTNRTSSTINVPAGITRITFIPAVVGNPILPADLVELYEVWESLEGQNAWTPVVRQNFLTQSLSISDEPVSLFGVYTWNNQEIGLLESNQDNDLKLDYLASLFFELTEGNLNDDNRIINTDRFLEFRTAAFAAEFIDENEVRAQSLMNNAGSALQVSMGISVKAQQSISIRRRPFRAAFKRRRMFA